MPRRPLTEEEKLKMKEAREAKQSKAVDFEARFKEMDAKFDKLTDIVFNLAEKQTETKPVETKVEQPKELNLPPDDAAILFPSKWRVIVDEELGNDFKALIDDSAGGNFLLKVIVPSVYDCRIGDDKNLSKDDIRIGLINRASAEADVRTWCKRFAQNIRQTYANFKKV
jgi:hypothetical protein